MNRALVLAVALLVPLASSRAGAAPANGGRSASSSVQTLPYGEVVWGNRGHVRVSAVGWPPLGATGYEATEGARRNALALAQRRLLDALLDLPARDGKVRDLVAGRPEVGPRVRNLIASAAVKDQRMANGSVEVTLTVRMAGPGGVQDLLETP